MKKAFFLLTTAAVLAVACDSGSNAQGGGNTNPLTPEENRAKLEQIGLDAINMASPDKQIELLEAIDKFYEYTSEYSLDFRADIEEAGRSYRPVTPLQPASALMQAAGDFARTGNPYVLSKAVVENSYIYEAGRVYGIYEFTGSEWVYTPSDSELTFIFPSGGKKIRATVSGSGAEYSYTFEDRWNTGGYTDYDEYGNPVYVPGTDHTDYITITVPARVSASITADSRSLLSLEVNGEYNEGSRVSQTLSLAAGSYDVDMSLEITNSRISQSLTFDIDGTRLLGTEVSASGTDLCKVDSYRENVENMFSDASVKVSVLDLNVEARSTGNISSFISDFTDMDDEAYNSWHDDPEILEPESNLPPTWASESYIGKLSDLLNSNFTVTASYGANQPFADVIAKPKYSRNLYFYDNYLYKYEWGSYYTSQYREFSGYEVSAIIKFRNDGAEFDITDFFNENDYASVVDAAESLADRYEYYMDYMFGY